MVLVSLVAPELMTASSAESFVAMSADLAAALSVEVFAAFCRRDPLVKSW